MAHSETAAAIAVYDLAGWPEEAKPVEPCEDHPATFTDVIIDALREMVRPEWIVVDPFAGVGTIHELNARTVGIELEPEWVAEALKRYPGRHTEQGNACYIPLPDQSVDAIVTSPSYGNRMADQYLGDSCKECDGTGQTYNFGTVEGVRCAKCKGKGHSTRATYATALGRKLSEDSGAALQWGEAYKVLHAECAAEMVRVIKIDGVIILNISDHYRQGNIAAVSAWWIETLVGLGAEWTGAVPIRTPRNGFGANAKLRCENEWVLTFTKRELP